MRLTALFPFALVLLLAACGEDRTATPEPAAAGESTARTADPGAPAAEDPAEHLDQLFAEYWEENLELNPVQATFIGDHRYNDRFPVFIAPDYIEKMEAFDRKWLEKVQAMDPGELSGEDRVSYDIFLYDRRMSLRGYQYPGHLIPVNQFFSVPNFFAQMGSGQSAQPFNTAEDYDNFLGRIDGFTDWVDQAIANMQKGVEQGVVQPRVLMEKTLPQLAAHIVEKPEDSLFYRPVEQMPETFSEADRERLTAAYRMAISDQVVPAYRRLHAFIENDYMPHTRETVGLSALPEGDAWYDYRVENTTTTDLSPQRIHEIGLSEVERIHGEMRGVMEEVGFEGDLHAFFEHVNESDEFYYENGEQLVQGYEDLRDRVESLAPKLFTDIPDADYEIRPVEPFREQSASGASYMRSAPDGSRPGVFYVNTYDIEARPKWAMESLFLHEAVPGHHFQIASQQALEALPAFRRFGGYTAYVEGWGLYAESLGKELGAYTDPYQYFGALNAELWRAIRLVTDTGMHHLGWTREQALDYMYANSAVKEARAVSEAERYIAIPSQALAYKIGQLKISELRAEAEQALGDDFDVKAFHSQVLDSGSLPLDVLEAKIDRWIKAEKAET